MVVFRVKSCKLRFPGGWSIFRYERSVLASQIFWYRGKDNCTVASSRCSVSQGATRKTARNSAFSFFSRAVFRAEPLTERLEEAKTRLSVLARITSSPRLSSIVRLTLRIRNSGTILWSCMLTARNFIFRKIFFGTQSCFHQVTVHIKEKEELSWSINDDLKISRFKSPDTIYVPVKSKLQHPPPPGNPPGIWIFGKFLFKFPTPEAEKLFKCPIIGPFQVIKCRHPRGNFSVAFIMLRELCM